MSKERITAAGAVVGMVLAVLLAGCGGGGGSTSSVPTAVSAADLQKGAAFWLSLEPALRRELATICHSEQVGEGPDEAEGVAIMQGLDIDSYVALINREYEKRGEDDAKDIGGACDEAKLELLGEQFRQLVPHLRGE